MEIISARIIKSTIKKGNICRIILGSHEDVKSIFKIENLRKLSGTGISID